MIQPIHTTLTPILAPDDAKHRAELAVYLGDAKVSTLLLELDDAPTCDRCGQVVGLMHEVEVDEHGCRHDGECPESAKDTVTLYVPAGASAEEIATAIEDAQADA